MGAGVTAAVVNHRVPQTLAYGLGMNSDGRHLWLDTHTNCGRMGRPSTLGGHVGADDDTMGANCIEKGNGSMV